MMGSEKYGEAEKQLMIQRMPPSVKHGRGNITAWIRMADSRSGSLLFIDDVTADRSSRMNCKMYMALLKCSAKFWKT